MNTADEVEHPWCVSSHDEFVGFLSYNILSFGLHEAIQRVNSVVWLARYSCYCRYRFLIVVDKQFICYYTQSST